MLTRMLQHCSHCNRHAAAIALRNRSLRPVVTGGEAARQQSTFATTSNDDCSPSTIRVAFFGTDDFAVPTLVALSKLQGIAGDGSLIRTEVEVFCPADRGKRRGKTVTQPVRKFAEEAGLPISNFPCMPRNTLPLCLSVSIGPSHAVKVDSCSHLLPAASPLWRR